MKKIIFILSFLSIICLGIYSTFAISNSAGNQNIFQGTWYGKGSSAGRIGNTTIGDLDYSRSTWSLTGNLNSDIGIKWKQFIGGVNLDPTFTYGGADINGDARHDFFYVKGGKGYLIDLVTGYTIWETKVLGINKIIGVEGVLGENRKKQIVFIFGDNPFYVGILDGRTGELITTSKTWGTLGEAWTYTPNFIKEKQNDGSVIYTFSRWRSPIIGIKISGTGTTVQVTPQYENRYKASNGTIGISSTDDYSGNVKKMNILGKNIFLLSDSSTAYFTDISSPHNLSVGGDYSMANFHTFTISPTISHGYENNVYDLNVDGNDEFIMWRNEIGNYFQKTKLFVGGAFEGQIKNFWGISWPLGTTISKVLPIKNSLNPQESYVAVRLSGSTKYQFYAAMGNSTGSYVSNVSLGANNDSTITSFNEKYIFEYDINTYGDILGIFDNGNGEDYIVTRNSSNIYHLFFVNGPSTFDAPANIQITGTHYDLQEKNFTNYGLKYGYYEVKGGDINGNGKREFATIEGAYLKHYEISGNTKTLVSEIEFSSSENTQYTSRTRQYTFNGKDLWSYRYNATDNTLKIYKTNTLGGQNNFTHLTQNFYIYSVGQTSPISIFKHNSKNYLHFGNSVYDSTSATPNTPPTKVSTISNSSIFIDTDNNGTTDLIEGGKVYSLDGSFNKSVLYNNYGTVGDFDGDNVLDRVYTFKDVDGFYKYYPISGVDGSQIYPAISTANTSCGPSVFSSIRISETDKDDLVVGSSWCGHSSRIINPSGNLVHTLNHLHTIQAFDIDQDGVKDLFGQDNNYGRYQLQATKILLGSKSTFFNTPIYTSLQGDIGGGVTSVNRDGNGNINFVVKGLRGEIIGLNSAGQILFRSHYYDGERYAGGENDIYNAGGVPLDYADVVVGDINGDNNNEIIAAGFDGWLYIINVSSGDIMYKYDIGSSITNAAFGDPDNIGKLSIILSAQDGYVYRVSSAEINPPGWVKDGSEYNIDIEMLEEDTKASVNFEAVPGAVGYFVQLYNHTKKSPVFDWINIGNNTTACIQSAGTSGSGCTLANTVFNLTNRSVYEWRVQSYNNLVTSQISKSNGFIVTAESGYFIPEETPEEEIESIPSYSNKKSSYEEKRLKTFGNGGFMILNTDNSPIKSKENIDIVLTDKEYKIITSNQKIISGSGSALSQIISNFNCKNILLSGGSTGDGIYTVTISGGDSFQVYCDMTTDGGGWTLIALANTSHNTFGRNLNRASPFVDFYKNEIDEITGIELNSIATGVVLKYERRKDLINYSEQTLIKGIKGTSDSFIYHGKLNFSNRLVSSNERLGGKFYWDSLSNSYINNNSWRTSLQNWGNNCGRIENIASLNNDILRTAQKNGVSSESCLGVSPENPIGIGRFIR